MGGLFDSGGTTSTIQKKDTLDSNQKGIMSGLNSLYQKTSGGPNMTTPFQTYAGVNQDEQNYFDYARGGYKDTAAGQAMLNVLSGRPSYEINPNTTEQYYQDVIKNPAMREFNDNTLTNIQNQYAGPSYWSSGRAKAQDQATDNLSNTLTTERAKLYYADEEARRKALESAAGREATLAPQAATFDAELKGSAGMYSRQIEQEKIASDLNRWLSGEEVNGKSNPLYNPANQLGLALLGVQTHTYATNTETKASGGGAEIVGAAASAAAAA